MTNNNEFANFNETKQIFEEMFEAWKKDKSKNEIDEMQKKIDSVNQVNEIKMKRKILAMYYKIKIENVIFDDYQNGFLVNDRIHYVVNSHERFEDIRACIFADLGNAAISYNFLKTKLKMSQEEIDGNLVQDMIVGGIFKREYMIEKIEKELGFDKFVKILMNSGDVPEYSFLRNEAKLGEYFIQFQK